MQIKFFKIFAIWVLTSIKSNKMQAAIWITKNKVFEKVSLFLKKKVIFFFNSFTRSSVNIS